MAMAAFNSMLRYIILILTLLPRFLADEITSNVLLFNADTFKNEIAQRHSFVMFFAPWCGHCKRLAPMWDELGEKFKDDENRINIAKVDCTVDTELCAQHDITAYPTIKLFVAGKLDGARYKGVREIDAFVSFVKEQLGINREELHIRKIPEHGLVELTEETFENHMDRGMHFVKFYAPWCGHCQRLAPTWEELAKSLEDDPAISIAKIDCVAHKSLCTKYDVDSYPTLMWFQDGKSFKKYDGERSHSELKKYVNQMKLQMDVDFESNELRMPEEPTAPVVILTTDNFKESISSGIVFIKFFAPWCGHCQRLAPAWEDLARKVIDRDNIKIAKVDCTLNVCRRLCKDEGVDAYPTMVLYKNGQKVEEYSGARDVESMFSFVMNQLQHEEL